MAKKLVKNAEEIENIRGLVEWVTKSYNDLTPGDEKILMSLKDEDHTIMDAIRVGISIVETEGNNIIDNVKEVVDEAVPTIKLVKDLNESKLYKLYLEAKEGETFADLVKDINKAKEVNKGKETKAKKKPSAKSKKLEANVSGALTGLFGLDKEEDEEDIEGEDEMVKENVKEAEKAKDVVVEDGDASQLIEVLKEIGKLDDKSFDEMFTEFLTVEKPKSDIGAYLADVDFKAIIDNADAKEAKQIRKIANDLYNSKFDDRDVSDKILTLLGLDMELVKKLESAKEEMVLGDIVEIKKSCETLIEEGKEIIKVLEVRTKMLCDLTGNKNPMTKESLESVISYVIGKVEECVKDIDTALEEESNDAKGKEDIALEDLVQGVLETKSGYVNAYNARVREEKLATDKRVVPYLKAFNKAKRLSLTLNSILNNEDEVVTKLLVEYLITPSATDKTSKDVKALLEGKDIFDANDEKLLAKDVKSVLATLSKEVAEELFDIAEDLLEDNKKIKNDLAKKRGELLEVSKSDKDAKAIKISLKDLEEIELKQEVVEDCDNSILMNLARFNYITGKKYRELMKKNADLLKEEPSSEDCLAGSLPEAVKSEEDKKEETISKAKTTERKEEFVLPEQYNISMIDWHKMSLLEQCEMRANAALDGYRGIFPESK